MSKSLEDATIIIVEDDANSSLATLDLLKMEGFKNVHACASGDETMKLAETLGHIDIFLVDIYMSGETGYDLIKRIRDHADFAQSKIVALTASVMYDDIRRIKQAGFDSFIGKPIRPARFSHQLRKILAGEALWEWR